MGRDRLGIGGIEPLARLAAVSATVAGAAAVARQLVYFYTDAILDIADLRNGTLEPRERTRPVTSVSILPAQIN